MLLNGMMFFPRFLLFGTGFLRLWLAEVRLASPPDGFQALSESAENEFDSYLIDGTPGKFLKILSFQFPATAAAARGKSRRQK